MTAIKFAEANNLTLSKYNDPTEDAREGLTLDEARAVAREDARLIWVEAPNAYSLYGYRGMNEGHWHVALTLFASIEDAIPAAIAAYEAEYGKPTPEQERITYPRFRILVGLMVSDHGKSKLDDGGRSVMLYLRDGKWER